MTHTSTRRAHLPHPETRVSSSNEEQTVMVQQEEDEEDKVPGLRTVPRTKNPASSVAGDAKKKKATAGGNSTTTTTTVLHDTTLVLLPSSHHEYVDHLNDDLFDGPVPRVGVKEAFPFKLHKMLKMATLQEFEQVVSWQPHGRAFRVHDRDAFIRDIMPQFFHQTKITSFNRQLCLYGFVRLTAAGEDRGAYYHGLCIRGRPDLLRRLHRTRIKGTGKKAAASPKTEPDFYRMPFCPAEVTEESSSSSHSNSSAVTTTSPQRTLQVGSPVQQNDHHHTTKIQKKKSNSSDNKNVMLVTPNPSPRRTSYGRSMEEERLSPSLLPEPCFLPMPPLSTYSSLSFVVPAVQQQQQKYFLPVPFEEEEDGSSYYDGSDEPYLDSKQFSFAWDDVDV